MKQLFCGLVFVVALAAVSFSLGFAHFAARVMAFEEPGEAKAEGIVALTGGPSRISDALRLLAEGRGERLLITGVHPRTSDRELARRQPEADALFSCCVDLDYDALNTVGNAEQTREWVETTGFKSLIVVTSSYHIPRSMAELGHAMPDVSLIPYPVVSDGLRVGEWWADDRTRRLLFQEYLKYVVALTRQNIGPVPSVGFAHAARLPVPEM